MQSPDSGPGIRGGRTRQIGADRRPGAARTCPSFGGIFRPNLKVEGRNRVETGLSLLGAQRYPQNRSIGWDIVITPEGPGLIEGNHDWCKLVWQLPVGRSLKQMLEECAPHG